ncbi:hypothetical protein SLA_4916 [Streptomyces laurentii]|uniref:DUF4232 domain-containing protein n=1 Tax=Streptomyces laurentii TaxID=39478 RepID=A0A160P588_STRLU|nr:hypothetical protein SLA_4916 [Streptomyces laurentii]
MRTHRRNSKNTVLAVAAVAALSLGLTACGGTDDKGRDEGAAAVSSSSASAPADAPAAPAGQASGTTGTTGATTAGTTTTSGGAATGGKGAAQAAAKPAGATAGKTPSCTFKDVKVTMRKADEVPTEHIELTATNTSGRTCRLDGYPLLAFGQIQTAKDIPPVAKSKPGAPVVLRSGTAAYANVRVANGGAHEDNKVVTSFSVNFFTGSEPTEGSVDVKAPAGGLAVDEAVAKTGYWTYELRNGADEF